MILVEKLQRMILPGFEGLSYKERLNSTGNLSLEERRPRADMTEIYNIMGSIDSQCPSCDRGVQN